MEMGVVDMTFGYGPEILFFTINVENMINLVTAKVKITFFYTDTNRLSCFKQNVLFSVLRHLR